MTAKEMFKELGFKEIEGFKGLGWIRECNETRELSGRVKKYYDFISFDTAYKGVNIRMSNEDNWISFSDLQAINKQVEELWGDEILKKNGNK